MRDQCDALIAAFGDLIGIPELTLDETGSCLLEFDHIGLNLQWDEANLRLLVYSILGEVAEPRSLELYAAFLEANFLFAQTKGTTLGVDPASRQAALSYSLSINQMTDTEFQSEMEGFINLAEAWIQRISEPPKSSEEEPSYPMFAAQFRA